MNENISIKEGGITRKFSPIDKVKVNNTDESESIWVPKDDMNTGTLYATENGIYIASEDGYSAYDEVVIRVTDESYDGGGEWEEVYPYDDYGRWDEVTYEAYLQDPDAYDAVFNDPTKWDDPGENLDYKYGNDPITGIDPDTGFEMAYSTDDEGYLNEELVPTSIKIIVPPNKLSYLNYETIVFTGISVCAYIDDSTTWEDSTHKSGIIPFKELVFPVTRADYSQISEETIEYPDYSDSGSYMITSVGSIMSAIDSALGSIATGYEDEFGFVDQVKMFCASFEGNTPAIVSSYQRDDIFDGWGGLAVNVFVDLHVDDEIILGNNYSCMLYRIRGKRNKKGDPLKFVAETGYEGGYNAHIGINESGYISTINAKIVSGGTQTIPVQWARSWDGKMLEDSFEIIVYPKSAPHQDDGSHSGGSGDDSGDSVLDKNGKFTYEGKKYKTNTEIDATVHFSNGIIWVEAGSWGSQEYTVNQALDLGLIALDE